MSGHQRSQPISDEWLTPPEIIRALGPFDLDPCTTYDQAHSGLPWHTATKMFSKEDNGLAKPWSGFVWMNPPYGTKTGHWLAKLAKHGNGIALVFARTDVGWFHDLIFKSASGLFFPAGRIRFYKPDGRPGGYTGGAPSVFVSFGEEAALRLAGLNMTGRFVRMDSKNDAQYAWAAGLIDGEGCIHIRCDKAHNKTKHRTDSYSLMLKVSMCHEETVRRLQDIFGRGSVRVSNVASARRSQAWSWYCMGREAVAVLRLLRPFMVTKKAEAEVASEFGYLPSARRGHGLVPPEIQSERIRMYSLLRSMKSVNKLKKL